MKKLKSVKKLILHYTYLLVFIYLFLCVVVYFMQGKMLFLPDANPPFMTPESASIEFLDLTLKSSDHEINAWFIPLKDAKGTVLFCHGNAGNMGHRIDTLKIWRDLGYNVMFFDYAGYGNSTGTPSEVNLYSDVTAVYRWLLSNGILKEDILVHGRSLGGASAAYIAEKEQLPALILESTFTSVPDMASSRFPWLPTSLLCTVDLDTAQRLRTYSGALMVLHSPDDEVIPYFMGEELAKIKNSEIRQLQGGHNDVFYRIPEYKKLLLDFLQMPEN